MKKYILDKLKSYGLTNSDFYIETNKRGKEYNLIFYTYNARNKAYNSSLETSLQNIGFVVEVGQGINLKIKKNLKFYNYD